MNDGNRIIRTRVLINKNDSSIDRFGAGILHNSTNVAIGRTLSMSDTGITFGASEGNYNSGYINGYCIPAKIYGIKDGIPSEVKQQSQDYRIASNSGGWMSEATYTFSELTEITSISIVTGLHSVTNPSITFTYSISGNKITIKAYNHNSGWNAMVGTIVAYGV